MIANAAQGKSAILRAFLNSHERLRQKGPDFARRRSGVRIPSAPLLKYGNLQVKRESNKRIGPLPTLFDSHLTVTRFILERSPSPRQPDHPSMVDSANRCPGSSLWSHAQGAPGRTLGGRPGLRAT